ncbi:MAG: hypothetical protein K2X93_28150 [Candidatus Obscuribacterales bacterium]|nr:hypothetical protein [Candidatus Obscuribacterales bacterium]
MPSRLVVLAPLSLLLLILGEPGLALHAKSAQSESAAAPDASTTVRLRGPLGISPSYTKLIPEVERGLFVLKQGSVFPVTILSIIDSKTAKLGDPVDGALVEDLTVGDKIVAAKGSYIKGWISAVHNPRNVLESKFCPTNWLNSNAALSVHFSNIQTKAKGGSYQIDAQPAPGTPLRGDCQDVSLSVRHDGCITVHWNGIKYGATGAAISAVSWLTGPYKLITGPIMSGTAGAIQPAYAFDKPVAKEDALTRAKGGLVGAVKGLPGGFIVTGIANHGGDIAIPSGTEMQVALDSDFVIPAATD